MQYNNSIKKDVSKTVTTLLRIVETNIEGTLRYKGSVTLEACGGVEVSADVLFMTYGTQLFPNPYRRAQIKIKATNFDPIDANDDARANLGSVTINNWNNSKTFDEDVLREMNSFGFALKPVMP
jgi:hypothetical protein